MTNLGDLAADEMAYHKPLEVGMPRVRTRIALSCSRGKACVKFVTLHSTISPLATSRANAHHAHVQLIIHSAGTSCHDVRVTHRTLRWKL